MFWCKWKCRKNPVLHTHNNRHYLVLWVGSEAKFRATQIISCGGWLFLPAECSLSVSTSSTIFFAFVSSDLSITMPNTISQQFSIILNFNQTIKTRSSGISNKNDSEFWTNLNMKLFQSKAVLFLCLKFTTLKYRRRVDLLDFSYPSQLHLRFVQFRRFVLICQFSCELFVCW